MDYEQTGDSGFSISAGIGVVLMFIGVVVAVFVAQEVLALYRHPEMHTFTVYITEKLAGAEIASATMPSGGALKIGAGGALLVALGVFAILAAIAGRLAIGLIAVGYDLTFGRAKPEVDAAKKR